MRMLAPRTGAALPKRRGFTLIEMLVVIAIIAVLAGLTAAAVMAFIPSQQEKTTRITIATLIAELDMQRDIVDKDALNEQIPPAVVSMAPGNVPLQRVLYRKFRQKQQFPQTFVEATTAGVLPAKYADALANLGPSAAGAPYESAACLLLAMSRSRGSSQFSIERMGAAVREFDTGNGVKVKAFVDSWGNPLVFCRWPSGDPVLNPAPGQPDTKCPIKSPSKLRDLQDLEGKLLNNPQAATYLGYQVSRSDGSATYVPPVIMSAGRDGKLGVNVADLSIANLVDAKDNLYSY